MLKLDEEHALEVQLDPHSFSAITREQIDAVLSAKTVPKVAPTVSEVIGCTLWRNGSESVAHRRFAIKETE
jgi:hypothetical protein